MYTPEDSTIETIFTAESTFNANNLSAYVLTSELKNEKFVAFKVPKISKFDLTTVLCDVLFPIYTIFEESKVSKVTSPCVDLNIKSSLAKILRLPLSAPLSSNLFFIVEVNNVPISRVPNV